MILIIYFSVRYKNPEYAHDDHNLDLSVILKDDTVMNQMTHILHLDILGL